MTDAKQRKPAIVPGASRRYCSERELAPVLGVSVRTLQNWHLYEKGPPWKRFCGAVRYDVAACEDWVRTQPGGGGAV